MDVQKDSYNATKSSVQLDQRTDPVQLPHSADRGLEKETPTHSQQKREKRECGISKSVLRVFSTVLFFQRQLAI